MPFYLEQRPNDYFHEFLTVPQWYVHIFFEIRIQLTIGCDWEFTLIHERLSGENDKRFQMSLFFIIFLITLHTKSKNRPLCLPAQFQCNCMQFLVGSSKMGIKCITTTYWRGDWIELLEKLAGSWNFPVSVTENTCFKKSYYYDAHCPCVPRNIHTENRKLLTIPTHKNAMLWQKQ